MPGGHWTEESYVPEPSMRRFEAELGRHLGARRCDGCFLPLGNEPRRMVDLKQYHPKCAGAGRVVTDCGGEGCEECDVCRYLNFIEWAQQCAPRGESTIERDAAIEAHLDQKYPRWRTA